MLLGGNSGPAVKPGSAVESRLFQAVSRDVPGVKAMPPTAALTADEVQTLRAWIDGGAVGAMPQSTGHFARCEKPMTVKALTGSSMTR